MSKLLPVVTVLTTLLLPTSAYAAVGDRLDLFTPSPSGNGRGIEIKPGTTIAYYSTVGSEDKIYMVNVLTHESAGELDTNLETVETGRSYGALSYDSTNGRLLGARYSGTQSIVDAIDPSSGAVTPLFDANNAAAITGADGLAYDPSDGTFWISADGLGLAATTIYHFSAAGAILSSFGVGFGNSGVVVDGDYLWLADVNNKLILKYSKTGTYAGTTISTSGLDEPEDLALDSCTFSGKKAIWGYTAAFSGAAMGAYEADTATQTGCSVDAPGAPDKVKVKKPKKGYRVGVPIDFSAPSTLDPSGLIFVYIWIWDDYTGVNLDKPKKEPKKRDGQKGKNKKKHKYQCAGFYRPKVKVLDPNGNERLIPVSKELTIDFPKSATKKHGSLKVGPNLVGSSTVARLSLDSKKYRKGKTSIKSIEYKIDGKRVGRTKKAKKKVKKKLGKGPHVLYITVKFKKSGGSKKIKTCFQLSS